MEQPVLDFINGILMEEEDKGTDTARPCILDNVVDDGTGAGIVSYDAIMKDFFDILAGYRAEEDSSSTTSSSTTLSRIPQDLQFRSPTSSGINHIYGNSSSPTLPGVDNHLLQRESHCSFHYVSDHKLPPMMACDRHLQPEEGAPEPEGNMYDNGSWSPASDAIHAFHDDRGCQRTSYTSAADIELQGEDASSDESSIEFGVWVERVLRSATLITNEVDRPADVLQSEAPSSTNDRAAAMAGHTIHDHNRQESMPADAKENQPDEEAGMMRTTGTIAGDQSHNDDRDRNRKADGSTEASGIVAALLARMKTKMDVRDFSFEEEMGEVIQADYEELYAGGSRSTELQSQKKEGGGTGTGEGGMKSGGGNGRKRKGSASVSAAGYYDLEELLLSCAHAVSRSDNKKAMIILQELKRQGATAQGRTCLHRMVFHFCRALEARLDGSGPSLYATELAEVTNVLPADSIRTWLQTFERFHCIKILNFFTNHSFLAACHGLDCLHVIDYGIAFGTQWAYLIKALSERDGGPPLLVLTGVQFPTNVRVAESTGRRLAEYAASLNVPFRFHAVAWSSKWEDLDADTLGIDLDVERRSKTAVVVNIFRQLQFVPDETVQEVQLQQQQQDQTYHPHFYPLRSSTHPHHTQQQQSSREKLLCRIRSLNPDLVTVGVINAGFNVPTFLTRFKNALHHSSGLLDMMEMITEDSPEKRLMERIVMKWILNVVACEGADRVVRSETYREWGRRLQRAGLEQIPVPETVLRRSVEYVTGKYHRDCTVMVDHNSPWLLTGWRGRTYVATSAWRPAY